MLIVQKYHSIHEIDSEFIPNIEVLLQEDVAAFTTLVQRHDSAPANEVFTYFLFFGPTQNAPIGLAQLCLKSIPSKYIPWQKKLHFWNKEYEHWKQATWKIGDGTSGMCVFDSRFARTGKEKVLELIREYEKRNEIKAHELCCLTEAHDFKLSHGLETKWTKESYVIDPLEKNNKSYQNYLETLKPEVQKDIKDSWKKLHKVSQIELGDYSNPHKTPKTLPIPKEQLEIWNQWGAQVLTFEQDLVVLGCLLVLKGRNGNFFFEPFPFEPSEDSIVSDELYIQYALLKFFETPEARKCHLMKFGSKIVIDDKEDLSFFESQGFRIKTIHRKFESELKELTRPL